VVKADGYGHGALAVGRAALQAGAWGLAVSTAQEAEELVDVVEPGRLLLLGGLAPADADRAARVGCAVTCHSEQVVEALELAIPPGDRRPVHLKVDTGMGRLGCSPDEAAGLARRIAGSKRVTLAGIYTHFAAAESDEAFTWDQFHRFERVLEGLDVDPGLRHSANSAAALRHPGMALDAVRCGIALYGCEWAELRPALALRAEITQVKDIPAGASVGYGRTWRAPARARVATVAIGYADGVMRYRSNRGVVSVGGRRAPLVGRVSMDQITVDVSQVPEARVGDAVTLIGEGISAEEVGEWSGTISYEVLTSLGNRVERTYRE
jgi:alanine racemase